MGGARTPRLHELFRPRTELGVRTVIRHGWEMLAVIIGGSENDSEAIDMLQREGAINGLPVRVLAEADLDYKTPLAIMPCSNVSGMTARLIYGDARESVSRIHGRPPLCVSGGVVHLRVLMGGESEYQDGDDQVAME